MGKVAVVEAVAESGYGNRLNSIPSCGASTVEKRTMLMTNAGRKKGTRGKPALQPRNKEKILAKGKAKATEKGKGDGKGKGNGEKGGKGESGKGTPSQTTPPPNAIPLPEAAEGEEGPSNRKRRRFLKLQENLTNMAKSCGLALTMDAKPLPPQDK